MRADGYWAIMTEISSTTVHRRTAWAKPATSKLPSWRRNAIRLSEARLHAVSSRNMYSEHGLDALIRPEFGQVCHSLMVVSYCTPGSALAHAALVILLHSARAGTVFATAPSVRRLSVHSRSSTTCSRNSLVTRTELLEFCPETVRYASESQS